MFIRNLPFIQEVTASSSGGTIGGGVVGGTVGSVLFIGAGALLAQDNANFFWDDTNNFLGIGTAAPGARLDITQAVATSGSPIAFRITGGAHTTLAASTEAIDVNVNLARTVQFATGALTAQRAFVIQAPTYGFVGASTITRAATLGVTDAPAAGTNATITDRYTALFEFSAVAGTTAIAAMLRNSTAATAGTTVQRSPSLALEGTYWDGSSALLRQFSWQVIPGAAGGTNTRLRLAYATEGGAYNNVLEIGSVGDLLWADDNSADVGASGASRPRSIYVGTTFVAPLGTAAAPSYTFTGDTNNGAYSPGADQYGITTAGVSRMTIGATGNVVFTQGVSTSGSPAHLTITGAAHTTLDNANLIDVNFNLTRTVQFTGAAGATTITRVAGVQILEPNYQTAGAGALTITDAATLYVDAPPGTVAGGGGTTITNAWCIQAAPDTDASFVFGRVRIVAASDSLQISHYDMSAAGSPALVQLNTGETRLQASGSGGGTVNLTMGGTNVWQVEVNNYDLFPVASNTRNIGGTSNFVAKLFTTNIRLNRATQTSVGAAGAATALPANPTGYFILDLVGTERAIPFYAVS